MTLETAESTPAREISDAERRRIRSVLRRIYSAPCGTMITGDRPYDLSSAGLDRYIDGMDDEVLDRLLNKVIKDE